MAVLLIVSKKRHLTLKRSETEGILLIANLSVLILILYLQKTRKN